MIAAGGVMLLMLLGFALEGLFSGGDDHDSLWGGPGADSFDGGAGRDLFFAVFRGGNMDAGIDGGDGADVLFTANIDNT